MGQGGSTRFVIASLIVGIAVAAYELSPFANLPVASPPVVMTAPAYPANSDSGQSKVPVRIDAIGESTASPPQLARDRIFALLRTATPESALAAFRIAQDCYVDAQMRRRLPSVGVVANADCASVTQRQMDDRLQWVRTAVDARVPHAAVDFWMAGPNGNWDDVAQRPDDQTVTEWRSSALFFLKRDAEVGDAQAMAMIANHYSGLTGDENDPVQTLGYRLAIRGTVTDAKQLIGQDRVIAITKLTSTADQIVAAEQLAASLLSKCKCARSVSN